jgi:predicted nucleic acid-binding Zn ribbon protein
MSKELTILQVVQFDIKGVGFYVEEERELSLDF